MVHRAPDRWLSIIEPVSHDARLSSGTEIAKVEVHRDRESKRTADRKHEFEEALERMKKRLLVVTLATALLAGVVAPPFTGGAHAAAPAATHTRAHAAFLDKTRFLLHAGAAYFAFHHWIYKPYKAHAFASGASGRTKAIIKAGIAALFAVHELKKAYNIAKSSHSATLHVLVSPISKFMAALQAVGSKFKSNPNSYSDAAVNSLNSDAGSLSSAASKGGTNIKDVPATVPGT
jgi:hypothetical protein